MRHWTEDKGWHGLDGEGVDVGEGCGKDPVEARSVIDDGRIGDSPPLEDYDDEMAAVCQALGIGPKRWQAGGRTLAGVPFWTVQKTEEKCRAFVDRIEGKRAHLIFAQYPEPTDAWALEAIKAAGEMGVRCNVTCWLGTWTAASWLEEGGCRDVERMKTGSGDLGPAMLQVLSATLLDALKPPQARQRGKYP